jgi:hypothetical protein
MPVEQRPGAVSTIRGPRSRQRLGSMGLGALIALTIASTAAAQSPTPAVTPAWTQAAPGPGFGPNAIASGVAVDGGGHSVLVGSKVKQGTNGVTAAGPLAWYSTDDVTWTKAKVAVPKRRAGEIDAVAAWSGGFVAVGLVAAKKAGRLAVATIWMSTDGISWTAAASIKQAVISDIADVGGHLVAIGRLVRAQASSPTAWTSTDGVTWTAESMGPDTNLTPVRLAASDSGAMVAIAAYPISGAPWLWLSPDGANWSNVAGPPDIIGSDQVPDIAAGPGGFDLIVRTAQESQIWTSPDGTAWDQVVATPAPLGTLVSLPGEMLAVGTGQTLASTDGLVWTTSDEPALSDVAFSAGTMSPTGGVLAVGSSGTTPLTIQVWAGAPEPPATPAASPPTPAASPSGPAASPATPTPTPYDKGDY